jgi:hypothetical protein
MKGGRSAPLELWLGGNANGDVDQRGDDTPMTRRSSRGLAPLRVHPAQ